MGTVPAVANVDEAMDIVCAALGYLAAADGTQLAAETQAWCCGRWSGPTRSAPPSGCPGREGCRRRYRKRAVKVTQAYRFALDPSPAQERDAAVACRRGPVRVELGAGQVQGALRGRGQVVSARRAAQAVERREEGRPGAGLVGGELQVRLPGGVPGPGPGAAGLHQVEEGRAEGQAARASRSSRSAGSAGTRSGSAPAQCAAPARTVTLPRLGTIRTHESTRKLARRLEDGTARILSATVSRTAQRWFVSFTVEVERAVPDRHARPGSAIGVDLGVKTLLTGVDDAGPGSHGDRAEGAAGIAAEVAPRQPSALPEGAGLARTAASPRPGWPASTPASRTSALMRCTRQLRDLAARYETVVAEDLNVTGMTRNRRLARAIADQGFGAGAADARLQDHLERRHADPR